MCLRVQEYVPSDEAPVHTLDDVQDFPSAGGVVPNALDFVWRLARSVDMLISSLVLVYDVFALHG